MPLFYKHAAPPGLKTRLLVFSFRFNPRFRQEFSRPTGELFITFHVSRIGGFGAWQPSRKAVGCIVTISGQGPTLPTQILKRFVATAEP